MDETKDTTQNFTISVIETYERLVDVEAKSQGDALAIVEAMYRKGQIVLDETNFVAVDFDFWDRECDE